MKWDCTIELVIEDLIALNSSKIGEWVDREGEREGKEVDCEGYGIVVRDRTLRTTVTASERYKHMDRREGDIIWRERER